MSSDGKVNSLSTDKQEKGGESSEEEADSKALPKIDKELREVCDQSRIPYDNGEARDALKDMLLNSRLPSDITKYSHRKRMAQARENKAEEDAIYDAMEEDAFFNEHGMTREDYDAYAENLDEEKGKCIENPQKVAGIWASLYKRIASPQQF